MPGTMRNRGGDSWYLEVTIGADFRGKPNRYSKTVHGTKKQAEKELAKFYAECDAGNISKSGNITLNDFCEKWLETCIKPRLKQNTVIGYENIINNRIKDSIGKKKLKSLSLVNIQEWINELSENLSPKTVRNAYSVLNNILTTAVKWEILSDNACRFVELPKPEKKEADFYTREEMIKLITLLQEVNEDKLVYKVGIELALFCGLRKGEIMGLQWEDIDFAENTVKIQRTRYIKKGAMYEDTPKTEKSKRIVSIPPELVNDMKQLKSFQEESKLKLGNLWNENTFILKNPFGKPLYTNSLWDWFSGFLKSNNMRHIGIHSLRHTHVSMLAALNIDQMQISRRIGHNQLSTTLNIYTHLFEETDSEIANKISDNFLKEK